MLCAIYKSPKKLETYLYVAKREEFKAVPPELLTMFGKPVFVTLMNLAKKKKLALANIDKVKQDLVEKGYYLQLPPPVENLHQQHRRDLGLTD